MFVKVLANMGVPITCLPIFEAVSTTGTEANCYTTTLPEGGVEITDLEYLSIYKAGRTAADKIIIIADGTDIATVAAEVHPDLTEITFYHIDTGEVIAIVPVDPETNMATLQVTAKSPGVIRIRAGGSTMTKLNEVVINAI